MRLLAVLAVLVLLPTAATAAAAQTPPATGFEQREGASWTTFEEEQAFLAAVDAGARRAAVRTIARPRRAGRCSSSSSASPGRSAPPARARGRPPC